MKFYSTQQSFTLFYIFVFGFISNLQYKIYVIQYSYITEVTFKDL